MTLTLNPLGFKIKHFGLFLFLHFANPIRRDWGWFHQDDDYKYHQLVDVSLVYAQDGKDIALSFTFFLFLFGIWVHLGDHIGDGNGMMEEK